MHRSSTRLRTLAPLVLAFGVAACGGGSSSSPSGGAGSPAGSAAASTGPSAGASEPGPTGSPAASAPEPSASGAAGSPAGSGTVVPVVAIDYAYQGIPSSVPAGTSFSLTNKGADLHELVLVRRNPGVTTPFQDILRMPEQEALKLVTIVGATLASPGQTAPQAVPVGATGDYLAVCFIPVGMKALPSGSVAPDASFGPPHYTKGMLQEFKVSP
jgi:hypothetical protein